MSPPFVYQQDTHRASRAALLSPFAITAVNFAVAYVAGGVIGKWAFLPIILVEWALFAFVIYYFGGGSAAVQRWLAPTQGGTTWKILALAPALLPLPLFLMHYGALAPWTVWLPWAVLALVNPWLEEFYYRGFLLDALNQYPRFAAVLFSALVFSGNHAVFGVNSTVNSGWTILVVTFIMGLAWAIVYERTRSLRWTVFAHFLVDMFNLSSAAFLDLFDPAG